MNMRAINLEKLNTVETESFTNRMRRFISRRGLPKKVFSDNRTNFVGTYSEVKTEIRNFLTKNEIN